ELVKAEQLDAQGLDPERHRWLVDRDLARRIEGVVEEIVPASAHAENGSARVFDAETILLQPPQAERRTKQQNQEQAGMRQIMAEARGRENPGRIPPGPDRRCTPI